MKVVYIVILKYTVKFEELSDLIPQHRLFLQPYYDDQTILFSGPLVDRTGGMVVLRSPNKEWVKNLFSQDPFAKHHVATYEFLELEVKASQTFLDHWLLCQN